VVIMDSKGESGITDTELLLWIEAANRLHILSSFENDIKFTDTFLDTIKIINEDDIVWKKYIRLLDLPKRNNLRTILGDEFDDYLALLTSAIITIHSQRLKIPFIAEDLIMAVDCTRACFDYIMRNRYSLEDFSKENLEEWTHNRHDWLPLELALDEFKR